MSDAQSLTLPLPGSRTRARRRRKLPPNWKWIIFGLCWDLALLTWNVTDFATSSSPISLLAAIMFALDAVVQTRRLRRADGGYRFTGEDRWHQRFILALWLVMVVNLLS